METGSKFEDSRNAINHRLNFFRSQEREYLRLLAEHKTSRSILGDSSVEVAHLAYKLRAQQANLLEARGELEQIIANSLEGTLLLSGRVAQIGEGGDREVVDLQAEEVVLDGVGMVQPDRTRFSHQPLLTFIGDSVVYQAFYSQVSWESVPSDE